MMGASFERLCVPAHVFIARPARRISNLRQVRGFSSLTVRNVPFVATKRTVANAGYLSDLSSVSSVDNTAYVIV